MYEFPFGAGQQLNLNWIINEIITLHHLLDPDWELPNFDNAFPYMNLNQLNLDWILRELKAIKDLAPSEDAQLLKMVANALIANTYNATTQYNVDDIVYRDDERRLYKCISATPAGGEPFDVNKWDEVDVGGVLTDLLVNAVTNVVTNVRYNDHKIQQEINGTYNDVINIEDTPTNVSDRLPSSKAVYNLNGALSSLDNAVDNVIVGQSYAELTDNTTAGIKPFFMKNGDTIYVTSVDGQTMKPSVLAAYDKDGNFVNQWTLNIAANRTITISGLSTDIYYVRTNAGTNGAVRVYNLTTIKNDVDSISAGSTIYDSNNPVPTLYPTNEYKCSVYAPDKTDMLPSGKTEQGFAIYNDLIFQMCADDYCIVKNLRGENISSFAITCGHGNSACFSGEFYDSSDEFPLLYVSDITGDVFVNRVTRTSATLIKTLYFDPATFGYTPQLAINFKQYLSTRNYAYVIGGNNSTPPYYPITGVTISLCDLSDLTQSGTKYIPAVLETFNINLTGDYIVLQGVKCLHDKIYLTSGAYDTTVNSIIYIIDPSQRTVENTLADFPNEFSVHELEDIDFIINPVVNTYDIIAFIREYKYYKISMPITKRVINPPDVFNSTKIESCDLDGTIKRIRITRDGWYQVRAINISVSGGCYCGICDYNADNYYAYEKDADGTYRRAITPWIYISKTQDANWFCARVWATDSTDSGIYFAPEIT